MPPFAPTVARLGTSLSNALNHGTALDSVFGNRILGCSGSTLIARNRHGSVTTIARFLSSGIRYNTPSLEKKRENYIYSGIENRYNAPIEVRNCTNGRVRSACYKRGVRLVTGIRINEPDLRASRPAVPLLAVNPTETMGGWVMETRNSGKGEAVRSVRPLNPDFAFLALKAAIELDNILQGKASSGEAVRELAKSLRETTADIGGSSLLSSLADPMSADLLSRAFERSSLQPVDTLGALVNRANEIASSLQEVKAGTEAERIKALRDFCLALSQVSSSFDQEERERTRPPHPHRT